MYALFDILTDAYEDKDFCSIRNHLSQLLNSRRGSLVHLPDYGIPDVTEVMQGLPYSLNDFVIAIKETIEKYEPRLQQISVQPVKHDSGDGVVLHLQISADSYDNNSQQFDSYFSACDVRVDSGFAT